MSTDRSFNLKILLFLSLGHLITDIYQGALPTILPLLKERLGLSYTMAGAIMMAANFTSSVIQPLFGYLSDAKEKPIFLPLGCLCAGIGLSLVSLPSNVYLVLMLVILSGLGVASYHPEGYKTAHFFTGDKPATGMSVFSVGGNLGFALGPMIALSVVTHFGFDALPSISVLGIGFAVLSLVFWGMLSAPKPRAAKGAASSDVSGTTPYVSLALVIAIVVARSWAQMGLMAYIPFYYVDYLKGDPFYAGQLVSVFLFGGVAGTLLGSPLADRWGHRRFLRASLLLSSLLLPMMFFLEGVQLVIALAVIGMVLICTFTVTIVMAQQLLPGNLGIASGLMVGFAIGTGGLGVTILGLVADAFGVPFALKTIMALPVAGFLLSLLLKYPVRYTSRAAAVEAAGK
ncbi:MAG: MFS transporter [Desulfomonile sp.]|nr:MFS transporter [Desulfomonile sp.]